VKSVNEARNALARLLGEVRACRICVERPLGNPLPHLPRPVVQASATARILIAGQAPGTRVHASGRPFTDPSGDRLRDWLGVTPGIFYDSSKIAILPMGFCFPGQDSRGADLPPRRECSGAWRQRLLDLLPDVSLVVALGLHAHKWHLGQAAAQRLTENVMNWRRHAAADIPVFPLPHPSWRNNSWLNRNLWFEKDVLPALRAEVANRL
jgi:uracil-DNA glycosylase